MLAGREDLELSGAAVLFAHDQIDRQQYDTLGLITGWLQRTARAWGCRDGSPAAWWRAILAAASIGRQSGIETPPGADAARRQLAKLAHHLNGSHDLVLALAERQLPPLVARAIEHRLTPADRANWSSFAGASTGSPGGGKHPLPRPAPNRIPQPAPATLAAQTHAGSNQCEDERRKTRQRQWRKSHPLHLLDYRTKRTEHRAEARSGRTCATCGTTIEAARSTRQYCSDRCRICASRMRLRRDERAA